MIDTHTLTRFLDQPEESFPWFSRLGFSDPAQAHSQLLALAQAGVTLDLLVPLCSRLELLLGRLPDPEMVFRNMTRFFLASRSPLSLATLLERDPESLPILLQIFSTSQHLSDLLIQDPESFDLVRMTDGQPVARETIVQEICSETEALADEAAVMMALRRYKRRETLRIAYGDLIRRQSLDTVTRQISFLADALCEAAFRAAWRKMLESRSSPRQGAAELPRFVVLALGKLGGCELNYSSDIDLILLGEGGSASEMGRSPGQDEFFAQLARHLIKLLGEATELGSCYRVDLRLRPHGKQGPLVLGTDAALRYYEFSGRTWERQAFVKARVVAGHREIGELFLAQLGPWIYRNYLSRADISGIQALKRRIEQRSLQEGEDERNVKTGHGGIRDIEYTIQFLQLMHGGQDPQVRTGNTLDALARLEERGCLTAQERTILEESYTLLRKVEHRLQIMFDLQTHTLPGEDSEQRKLALRLGYADSPVKTALVAFQEDYHSKTEATRRILNFLLHNCFRSDEVAEPEVDLVLDPDPPVQVIRDVLGRYGFRDVTAAYHHLMALATEKIAFLSTRRCRHFLAAIAARLLQAIAATPDPDATLIELTRVSDSLGGKAVLWELFSFHHASLKLYVHLCATSPYLTNILTSNPGMADELLDSLMLDKLPSLESMEAILSDLCRGAEDLEPILHSFKNSMHLRVGVRDVLGKEDIRRTHQALSDVAEVCLQQLTLREYLRLVERYGEPTISVVSESDQVGETVAGATIAATTTATTVAVASEGRPCEFVMLAMGKLGGREPNYHSDLDVIFLYEGDGTTQFRHRGRRDATTTNQHFFSQLGQRLVKIVTQLGPYGRLYELDPRLRPTGKSGSLAVSLPELKKYFATGAGQLWERLALCKARPIYGSASARTSTMQVVQAAMFIQPWQPSYASNIRQVRKRLEESASKRNLKRAAGGMVDIEFIAQMLQLKHGAQKPQILVPGTIEALDALASAGIMSRSDAQSLADSYRFLRNIEARLRLMNTTARHDLPEEPLELNKLAFLLNVAGGEWLRERCQEVMQQNRSQFDRFLQLAEAET
ncbi:MAG: bifunctional [glutamate--ammonia ligase]-adenylyl-L-tyrosine phosphorylase/[glutamate--ammonia-ligase] adenylyltransferase [Planctomycetota bacterium]